MDNREPDIFEQIRNIFTENPKYFAVFVVLLGIFMLLAAIFNWAWIFQGHSYNARKIEGIANIFGRGAARFLFGAGGIACIILGIACIIFI
ncbi:MAG: immunity 17 family protein [Spirochaetales bacterium]|jgi:hypothetical protein|nr:immunity 17 family protein [Spirochaetales bacterium]